MPLQDTEKHQVQFLAEYINPKTTVTSIIVGNGLAMACGGPSITDIKSYLINQDGLGVATRKVVTQQLMSLDRIAESVSDFGQPDSPDNSIQCATLEEICNCLEPLIGKDQVIKRFNRALAASGELLPGIGHEVIAHLTHHGLINYIIDFNFDQLLQTALLEELGPDRFSIYRNEIDCSGLAREMRSSDQLKPILVKPHGEFPQDEAIRCTPAKVEAYPQGTYSVLKTILERSNILIIIGYSASDPDFQALLQQLNKHIFPGKIIVWVEKNTTVPRSVASALSMLGRSSTLEIPQNPLTYLFTGVDANEFLEVLGEKCAKEHSIPNVTRHKIRATILSNVLEPKRSEAKFIVEALILAAKLRGFLNLAEIKSCARLEAKVRERTQPKAAGMDAASLLRLLVDGGCMVPIDEQRRTYLCDPAQLGQQIEHLFDKHGWLQRQLDAPSLNREFERLSDEFDIDVDADKEPLIGIEFPGATPICSMRELISETRKVIKGTAALRISTFRGEWLTSSKWSPSLTGSTVQVLILGHSLYPDKVGQGTFYEKRQAQTINTLRNCDGYSLRRNMDNQFNYCATINPQVGAIIFRRKVGSPIISPYLLSPGAGLKVLIGKFDQAWNCGSPMEDQTNSKEAIRDIIQESMSELGMTSLPENNV